MRRTKRENCTNARMPRVVHKERREPSGRVNRVVDGEFGKRQEGALELEGRCVAAQDVFEGSVDSLRLPTRLWMCCRRHLDARAEQLDEMVPEGRREHRIAIGHDRFR
ncbi:hypothetical protein PI124_g18307 [Phytophthora idaei]|nr:hypothetical protein PI125_g20416 [Phytophthora idaei]KAG3134007.1 hypothetical protein PI126_g18892 [Phytophthora idaei]KAG3236691.1 hypothetical protein PI124_g18307 [Phytophthora idaei]